jgi:hypothetical protein
LPRGTTNHDQDVKKRQIIHIYLTSKRIAKPDTCTACCAAVCCVRWPMQAIICMPSVRGNIPLERTRCSWITLQSAILPRLGSGMGEMCNYSYIDAAAVAVAVAAQCLCCCPASADGGQRMLQSQASTKKSNYNKSQHVEHKCQKLLCRTCPGKRKTHLLVIMLSNLLLISQPMCLCPPALSPFCHISWRPASVPSLTITGPKNRLM